jgi:hypothetical protein
MGKRGSKDEGAEGSAEKPKRKRKAKQVGYSTVLRPVLFGAAILAIAGAVLPKVI